MVFPLEFSIILFSCHWKLDSIMFSSVYIELRNLLLQILILIFVMVEIIPGNHVQLTKTTLNVNSLSFFIILTQQLNTIEPKKNNPLFQLVPSISVPVFLPFAPERRILMDWCLQMSFELPRNTSNTLIWPVEGRQTDQHPSEQRRDIDFSKYQGQESLSEVSVSSIQMHPYDWTAGELYFAIEQLLMRCILIFSF